MGDGFAVRVEALHADAAVWSEWSSRMDSRDDALTSSLDVWAFSDQPGFADVRAAYVAKLGHLRQELAAGARASTAISERLAHVAGEYSEAENRSEAAVARAGS